MDYSRIIFAILGFSAPFFFILPIIKTPQKQRTMVEKRRIVSEALEIGEETVVRFQERYDCILGQICSYYLTHQDLEEALAGALAAMNGALEFALGLRKLQMQILKSLAGEVDWIS